jgi:hypothetical protein
MAIRWRLSSYDKQPYLRRTYIIAVALVIAAAPVLLLTVMNRIFGSMPAGRRVALWVTLALEIVFAIYKWGVGDLSRYTPPPPPTTVKPEGADTVTKGASRVSTA